MSEDVKAAGRGTGLYGAVYGVPSGEPFDRALVRFFEFRDLKPQQRPSDATWILTNGRPIGSTLTGEDGTFLVSYTPPCRSRWPFWRKPRVSLGFVVQGPETNTSTPVLTWSETLREYARAGEAFLIGVDEQALVKQWRARNAEAIAQVEEADRERRKKLGPPQVKDSAARLAKFRLTQPRVSRDADERVIDDEKQDVPAIMALNEKLIDQEYKRRIEGKLERPGVKARGKLPEETKVSRAGFTGLAAENRFSSVNHVLDRLRAERAAQVRKRGNDASK